MARLPLGRSVYSEAANSITSQITQQSIEGGSNVNSAKGSLPMSERNFSMQNSMLRGTIAAAEAIPGEINAMIVTAKAVMTMTENSGTTIRLAISVYGVKLLK